MLRSMEHPQHHRMGLRFNGRTPFRHRLRSFAALGDRHFTTRHPGSAFRPLNPRGFPCPLSHHQIPARCPSAAVVPPRPRANAHRRVPALLRDLHGAALHFSDGVGVQIAHHFFHPRDRVRHLAARHRVRDHRANVFLAGCGGPPVVVESAAVWGVHRGVRVRVRVMVLLEIGLGGVHARGVFLREYAARVVRILLDDGGGGIPRGDVLRVLYLQVRKVGGGSEGFKWGRAEWDGMGLRGGMCGGRAKCRLVRGATYGLGGVLRSD